MIRFEVRVAGVWLEVIYGTILQYNRLSYRLPDGHSGIAAIGTWRISESTINNPVYKLACWNALSADEKTASLLRKALNASQSLHSGSVLVA